MKKLFAAGLLVAGFTDVVYAQVTGACGVVRPAAGVVTSRDQASTSAEALRNYFGQVSSRLPQMSTPRGTDGGSAACAAEIKEVLTEASQPLVARIGGDALLDATRRLSEAVDATSGDLNMLAVKTLAGIGAVQIYTEQKIDPGSARYDFYAGPSFSLTPTGSWNNGAEVLFRSNTGRLLELGEKKQWYGQISSLFAYRALGGDQEVDLDGDGSGGGEDGGGSVPGFVSPFDATGGVASVDLRFSMVKEQRDQKSAFGGAVLGGAESLPLEAGDGALTTLKARGGIGGLYRTSYSDGALGELFVGYIHDSRYRAEFTGETEDSMNRIALSGILQLPSFNKTGSLRMAARIFASTPVGGGDASELRLSVLVAYDLRSIFSKL